jgi:Holliday junction resolvasome RuvABC endonuclease subunit
VNIIPARNKRIICIDNSTASTAYVIFNGRELESYGEINFPGKDTYERIVQINDVLESLKKECDSINDLYIEQTTFVQSQKTVILLALAEGAVISSISHPGMKIHRVSPLVWQKYIGNPPLTASEKANIKKSNPGKTVSWLKNEHRRIRKQRTMDYINNKFGISEPSDNICDAFGLGVWAINHEN